MMLAALLEHVLSEFDFDLWLFKFHLTMAPNDPRTRDREHEKCNVPTPSSEIKLSTDGEKDVMQEEDADLLEIGVRDTCSSGFTPHFAPVPNSPSSLRRMEDISIGQCESHSRESRRNNSDNQDINFSIENRAITDDNLMQISEFQLLEDDTPEDGISNRFRCLSGDIRPLSRNFEEEATSDEIDENHGLSPISVRDNMPSPELDNGSGDLNISVDSSSRLDHRSLSYNRRMNEAAQFAEAVGEMPPLDHSEVRLIIEETDSDYGDDSDDEEVCVETTSLSHTEPSSEPRSKSETIKEPLETEATAQKAVKIETCRRFWKHQPTYSFLDKLPDGVNSQDFVYKGIVSNPPEITKRGISRGNYAQLHRKAWLEVSDKYHRYGKNLRLYYKHWESLGYPTNQFFDWLDSKGEAAGQPLPCLEECNRTKLDSDTVLYIANPDITAKYELSIAINPQGKAFIHDVNGKPVDTGPDGWIFVLRDGVLYGARKVTSVTGQSKKRFHHSSFFCGKAVAAAGILITEADGVLTRVYPHSGHYRPGEADMQRMLFHLHDKGVDLRSFDVDMQQILHVTRDSQKKGEDGVEKKKKKTQSLYLLPAIYLARLLAHKARAIGKGLFDQIHMIRKSGATNVTEALEVCDEGGYWSKLARGRFAISQSD